MNDVTKSKRALVAGVVVSLLGLFNLYISIMGGTDGNPDNDSFRGLSYLFVIFLLFGGVVLLRGYFRK